MPVTLNDIYGVGRSTVSHDTVAKFDPTESYAADEFVINGGSIYKAKGAVAAGTFDPTEWEEVGVSPTIPDPPIAKFDATNDYVTNDLVVYQGAIYRAKAAITAGAWNANDWEEIGAGGGGLITEFDSSTDYNPNDLIVHDGRIYRATAGAASRGATVWTWAQNDFVEIGAGPITEFDATATYNTNDLVVHDGSIYKAKGGIVAGAFNPNGWEEISVGGGPITEFNATKDYAANDLVVYRGAIYKAKATVTAGAWNATKWEEVGAGGGGGEKDAVRNSIAQRNSSGELIAKGFCLPDAPGRKDADHTDPVLSWGGYNRARNPTAEDKECIALGTGAAKNKYGTVAGAVAIGYNAAEGVTANASNFVSIGKNALLKASNPKGAVVIGANALATAPGADNSVFIGENAATSQALSGKSVMIGGNANQNASMGANNTVVVGCEAAKNGNQLNGCTIVGAWAAPMITGQNEFSTFIGNGAGGGFNQNPHAVDVTNCTLIGTNAAPSASNASNEITLGDTSITSLRCNVQTISALSDKRDKKDIFDSPYGLDFIMGMRPVCYSWDRRDGSMKGEHNLGFIAQEVLEVEESYSDNDYTKIVDDRNPDRLEMSDARLVPILVKAVQELTDKVKELESKLAK